MTTQGISGITRRHYLAASGALLTAGLFPRAASALAIRYVRESNSAVVGRTRTARWTTTAGSGGVTRRRMPPLPWNPVSPSSDPNRARECSACPVQSDEPNRYNASAAPQNQMAKRERPSPSILVEVPSATRAARTDNRRPVRRTAT